MTNSTPTDRSSRLLTIFFALGALALVFWALTADKRTDGGSQASPPEGVESGAQTTPAVASDASETTELSVMGASTTLSDNDASTLYVSPSGSDANSGQSPEIAFETIEHAIRSTKTGMTLFVMDGTFTLTSPGPTQIAFRRDGSPDAWTTITAAPGAKPVIIAREGTAFEPAGSYIRMSGLTVVGENFSTSNAYGVGILVADGHHFTISDNTVSGFPVGGIAAVRASHLRFERNVVFDNSKWGVEQGSGLSTWDGRNYGHPDDEHGYTDYFVDNVIYRNENLVTSKWLPGRITDGNGIIIDTNIDSGFSGRTLIANNIIVDNGGRAIMVYRSQRVDIVNNSTFANGRTGAQLTGGVAEISVYDGRDVSMTNNLAWNDGTWPTLLVGNSSDVTARGNGLVGGPVEGIVSADNLLINADPGLASAAPGPDVNDFLLQAGSPLIDAGVAVPSIVARDILGNDRQVGASIDIGAIEQTSNTSPPPPSPPSPPASVAPATKPASGLSLPPTQPSPEPLRVGEPASSAPVDAVDAVEPVEPASSLDQDLPDSGPAVEEAGPTASPQSLITGPVEASDDAAAEGSQDPAADDLAIVDATADQVPSALDPTSSPTASGTNELIDEVASDSINAQQAGGFDPEAGPPDSLAFITSTSQSRTSGPSALAVGIIGSIAALAVGLRAISSHSPRT